MKKTPKQPNKTIFEQLKDIEAQKDALRQKEKDLKKQKEAFFAEADALKDELLARWGISSEKTE